MKKTAALVMIGLLFTISLLAQDLAQWRGPNRDGIYNETGLLKSWPESGPQLLWHFEGLGQGHSSAAVYNDKVYTAGIIDGIGYLSVLT